MKQDLNQGCYLLENDYYVRYQEDMKDNLLNLLMKKNM